MKRLIMVLLLVLLAGGAYAQNIGGIGAQLILDTTGGTTMPRIYSLVANSPAYDSLKATDYIMMVNGISCKNKTIEEVVALIRGEAGTMVTVTTADTKEGARPRQHVLKRVGMNLGPQADPKEAFFAACDNEAKALRKSGSVVIKTFNSECGSFFFNFDAGKNTYHIRLLTLAGAPGKAEFTATARVFDNDHEAAATQLGRLDARNAANGVARLEGTATFTRECIGTIAVAMQDEAKGCRAMYVIVYK